MTVVMIFEWDENKNRANRTKHGIGFERARRFDFANALVLIDDDLDYGEERLKAIGVIDFDIYALVYVERGETIRVISLRPANRTEIRTYVES